MTWELHRWSTVEENEFLMEIYVVLISRIKKDSLFLSAHTEGGQRAAAEQSWSLLRDTSGSVPVVTAMKCYWLKRKRPNKAVFKFYISHQH